MPWGTLADSAGTTVLMQISQVSAALANLALGFAPTFWWAVAARFVGGLMNSITGANKTNIAHSFHLAHQVLSLCHCCKFSSELIRRGKRKVSSISPPGSAETFLLCIYLITRTSAAHSV